jgi:hypothetical protein
MKLNGTELKYESNLANLRGTYTGTISLAKGESANLVIEH